ncbi:hypothetical protein GQX73_g6523 [Xylaria multiplex]|uniref:Exonuclease domain-containing protein n=1 Tax=Xylaria multiplex TaxID=323545 RepID=A0A7C8IRA9_9PEZI|nr:hypothetical protein GQX73_g6523 [Xylaria multiplex]
MNLYSSYSLGFHRILCRIRHTNSRLVPALFGPTPCIVDQNRSTVVTVTATHHRPFSASGWHNKKNTKRGPRPRPPKLPRPYKWASHTVPHDAYDVLESYILDSDRRASERFPVTPAELTPDTQKDLPETLNPYNPERETPPFLDPDSDDTRTTYDALVIDCEMVAMKGREQGLLSIAVVDFFTGRIVLRSLVRPTGPVTDWRREVTGFNKPKLGEAIKKGKVLHGWWEAREKIFNVSTSDTIFIGHALANDLRVLRIATDRVVDSMIVMSRAVFGDEKTFQRNWGLKTACQELLEVDVQKTRGPHSPLEDALAARELMIRCVLNPEKLAEWGARKRADMELVAQKERAKKEAKEERKKLKEARKKRREAENKLKSPEQLAEEAAAKAEMRGAKKEARREARLAKKRERLKASRDAKQARKRAEKEAREAARETKHEVRLAVGRAAREAREAVREAKRVAKQAAKQIAKEDDEEMRQEKSRIVGGVGE